MPSSINRRQFLIATSSIAATSFAGCSDSPQFSDRYTLQDVDRLSQQREGETRQFGKGPLGDQIYLGYKGLAELPWFELDEKGRLYSADDSVPMAIDSHCHLGMSVFLKPELDLAKKSRSVRHILDCDKSSIGCELNLEGYINGNFTEHDLITMRRDMLAQGLWGSSIARTQTIPNLLSEMDAMRVEEAVLLPIKLGLWAGDNLTENWRVKVAQMQLNSRLRVGFSVHPRDESRVEQLRDYAKAGIKILKLHPTVQRFYPDDESMMALYAEAEKLGVVIFFHGGRAGIEPESSHPFALPRHYERPLAEFPNLRFVIGHAGARDNEAMFKMALKYPNAWFDTHGQGVTRLMELIKLTGGERLMFGTDWPFYHLGASLAKVLLATQDSGMLDVREKILRGTAKELFGDSFNSVRP